MSLAYQDEQRTELINGQIVAMAPRPLTNHNLIAWNIYSIFSFFLKGKSCTPFADGADLHLTEDDVFVPDMMVVCDRDKIKRDGVYGAPDLVVEVLSASTAKRDRGHKKDIYARCGVREYWIVNPDSRSAEVYLLQDGQFALHDVYTLYPNWMLEKMTEEERAEVPTTFRCSTFPELDIVIEDIFYRMLD